MGFFEAIKQIIKFGYYYLSLPEKRFTRFPFIGRHLGGRALVFGNGPSTKDVLEKYNNGEFDMDGDPFFVNYAPLDPSFFVIKPTHYFLSDFVFSRDTHDYRVEMTRRMYDMLDSRVDWELNIYLCFTKIAYCRELVEFSRIHNPNIHFIFLNRKHCSGLKPSLRHKFYKKGWFMPEEGTVVNTAIYVALIEGYKEIELYGVEHNMFLNLRMNEKHEMCMLQHNFYDKEAKLVPIKTDGDFERAHIHWYMKFISVMFESHYLLRQFADYLGARIINCTSNSMIDVYDFKE